MTDASQRHERGIPAFHLVPAMPWWLKWLMRAEHPYCRAAGPTSIAPSRMNMPLASLSQIRSGTCGSVRYTQRKRPRIGNSSATGMASRCGFLSGIARRVEACALYWSAPVSD